MDQYFKNEHTKLKFALVLFLVSACLSAQNLQKKIEFTSSNLPIVIIDTKDQEIPMDDPRAIVDMKIIYNGIGQRNNISDPANEYSGNVSIEIRGQSSAAWAKKSYSFETQNYDGTDNDVSILDLPEENDWILYAPYYDRSLMRNVLTFHLARQMGWYASRTVYCELVINGEYRGIYVLMEKIKRDKNRVDIAKLKPEEISDDDVTGGYLLRVDKEPWSAGFDSAYPPFPGSDIVLRYQYRYPDDEDIVPEQEAYIKEFMDSFEDVMFNGNYSDPDEGYEKYLNLDSFIDYVILNELSRNVDGYRLSAYMHKQNDSDGGKLIAGPVWDYNFSFGNVAYHQANLYEGWQLLYFADNQIFHQTDVYQMPFWWKNLFTDYSFKVKFQNRWNNLRQNILSLNYLNSTMDQFADTTAEARERNFSIWPEPGSTDLGEGWFPIDSRSRNINSYEDELNLTKNWIAYRIKWMDENIKLMTSVNEKKQIIIPDSYKLFQNYPNPFNPKTKINFTLPEEGLVKIEIYNILGEKTETLINQKVESGYHIVEFDGSKYSSGVYFYSIQVNNFRQTKKMLLMK